MWKKTAGTTMVGIFVLSVVFGLASQARAEDGTTRYPNMAPIERYLMTNQAAEIALARKAAPESISHDAEVMVLGRHGFETAERGKNGFVCLVTRSWTSAPPEDFWDPKVRVPMCFNAAASRSYLLRLEKISELVLAGRTKEQMAEIILAAVKTKELPPMEIGAMCYMMSKEGYGGDHAPHWPSHLMFFYSQLDPATWGANLRGSPVLGTNDPSEQLTQFVVPVQRWADGTQARPNQDLTHHH